ncbi:MAG: TPM domain-containing protein [Planctomycetaceae bacterium]|nr:TPM domain-containing protein [Planctomycetaceae bacterium]MBT6154147.1 TPM domain-containing protein [Planctomycetaceae bacterium]MBT6487856.1 TPM domain-containing protein [Planctomycetaceae bacterium]MBT6495682.1 TPM domain-containing protein [Planctomycetaceae bacterium]
MKSLIRAISFLALALAPRLAIAASIPPVPAEKGEGFFIQDYAGVIDESVRKQIAGHQQAAFENHDTPIIVVTISRMSQYGHSGSIEKLATEWFNVWRIGTADRSDGANKGILMLVSVGDRKARIELGADWGRGWDGHCQSIMQSHMIPNFKQEQYAVGIASGVAALRSMAESSPSATPPAASLPSRVGHTASRGSNGLGGCGSCLAAPFALLMAIMGAIFGKGGGGGFSSGSFSSSSSGGGYSGGGFSGGSSGGGGASGSW